MKGFIQPGDCRLPPRSYKIIYNQFTRTEPWSLAAAEQNLDPPLTHCDRGSTVYTLSLFILQTLLPKDIVTRLAAGLFAKLSLHLLIRNKTPISKLTNLPLCIHFAAAPLSRGRCELKIFFCFLYLSLPLCPYLAPIISCLTAPPTYTNLTVVFH